MDQDNKNQDQNQNQDSQQQQPVVPGKRTSGQGPSWLENSGGAIIFGAKRPQTSESESQPLNPPLSNPEQESKPASESEKPEEFPKTFMEGVNENRNVEALANAQGVIIPMKKAVQVLESEEWKSFSSSIPDMFEMEKEELKAAILKAPEPPRLVNNPDLYFDTSEADIIVDAESVELADAPGNPPGAAKRMAAAAVGKLGKRPPVIAAMRNGKLVVLDGKSTVTVASEQGLHIAIKLVENNPNQ